MTCHYGNNKVMPSPLGRQQGNLEDDDEMDPDHLDFFDVIDID